jgi:hypothetical protein
MRWLRASHLDMVGALSASSFRGRLLAMDVGGLPAAASRPAPPRFRARRDIAAAD